MKRATLPKFIKPHRYQIFLKPSLETFAYNGKESIFLDLEKPLSKLTLHAVDLKIKNVSIKNLAGTFESKNTSFNKKDQTVTFNFKKNIPKGKAELNLEFSGELTDKLKGFYRSKYLEGKIEKHLATTQFEATDARRAFPCFDEPAQKAIFDVSIQVPSHLTVVSNTIDKEIIEHDGGFKTVNFAPSPKMSTYLLAFIIGELEYIETKSKNGVVVRVFTTKGKKEQAKFALQTAARALDFYEQYFNIPYPLPVLDLIAIPDFASAAMENWGAITYRETALLFDEKNSSAANKQWVAIVIAHEIAHQWFGNLVTMEWWTDLWLNEGFASYMEYLCVDNLFPQWEMWDQYISERFAVALRLDALKNSHPIEVEVHHPDEISEIFDQVSYAKGSVVIRMLAEYLGASPFRDGLRHYLKKYSYKNTVTNDLWKSFERVTGKPVSKIMQSWTKTTGYPLLTLTQKNNNIKLEQSRFYSSAVSARNQINTKELWQIPVSYLNQEGKQNYLLLNKKQALLPKTKNGWVKFNYGESTLTRVKYPKDKLDAMTLAITTKKLPTKDRLGLVRDAFSLAEAGISPTTDALNLAGFYKNETALPVWEELAASLYLAGEFYREEPWFNLYESYCQDIFINISQKLGWQKKPKESHTDGLLRTVALFELGRYNHEPTIKKAREIFKNGPVNPDLRGVVYALVAQSGGKTEFEKFTKMYIQAFNHPEERERIGQALGHFKDKKILQEVLKFAFSKNIRAQDTPFMFIQVARNIFGRKLAWDYLKTNWDKINAQYNIGGHLLEYFVAPFSRFSTIEKAREIEEFFKKNPAPSIKRTINQVLERIYSNDAWVKRDKRNIEKWLKQK